VIAVAGLRLHAAEREQLCELPKSCMVNIRVVDLRFFRLLRQRRAGISNPESTQFGIADVRLDGRRRSTGGLV
jgi:hypothetical protein